MPRRVVRVGGRGEPGEAVTRPPPIGYDPHVLTKPITTVKGANAYIRTVEAKTGTLEYQKQQVQKKLDALIEAEKQNLRTIVRKYEGGPGVYLYTDPKKGKYSQESFTKFQEDTQKYVEDTDTTISKLNENISVISNAIASATPRTTVTREAVARKQYFTVTDPRTGVAAKFTDKTDALRYRDNLSTELSTAKRSRIGTESRQEWERMQEVASQSSQRVALAELVSEGIVKTGEAREGAVTYKFAADPKQLSQKNKELAKQAGFDIGIMIEPSDIQTVFGGGAGARRSKKTRNILLELFTDAVNFASIIARDPKDPTAGIRYAKESREQLGEFIRDLQDIGDITREKGGMPTKTEVNAYLKENPLADMPSRHADSPFRARTPEELYNRMVNTVANVAVGITKGWTLPLSWGVSPLDPEQPEEGVVQVITALLTTTPADRVLGEALKISKVDKAAVKTLSYLQRMGIRGQELLKKIFSGIRTTKTEDELFEAIAGSLGIPTSELRDTTGRLFTKGKLSKYRLVDDPELGAMVDRVLTDMTDVIDFEKMIVKFDDMPITAIDTQLLVTAELKRLLNEVSESVTKLTDIDPGLDELTRWGILSDSQKAKVSKALEGSLDEIVETHFGVGGADPSLDLFKVIDDYMERYDIDEYFMNVDDMVDFINNNPRGTAFLIEYLNQPVKGSQVTDTLLRELQQPWDIETNLKELGIDLEEMSVLTSTEEELEQKIELPPIEIPSILPVVTPTEIDQILDIDIPVPPIDIDVVEPIPVEPEPVEPDEPLPVDPILRQVELLRRRMLREGTPGVAQATKALRTKLGKKEAARRKERREKPKKKRTPCHVSFNYSSGASETVKVSAKTLREGAYIAKRIRRIKVPESQILQIEAEWRG